MKKRYKALMLFTGAVAIPAAMNHIIFKMAQRPTARQMKENFYSWRYGAIRYVTIGSGEPLLLVHGIGSGFSLKEWEDCIIYLSKQYKVYALDLIGFGNSEKPAMSYSSYLYISLINDFISEVIEQPAFIAANSDSAAYTVMACSFKPDNFKKLLLISPTGLGEDEYTPYPSSFSPGSLRQIVESPLLGTSVYNLVTSKLSLYTFLKEYGYEDESLITKSKLNHYYYMAHAGGVSAKYPMAAYMAGYLDVNIESQIKKITVPVHVVWGENNALNPVENVFKFKLLRPDTTYSIIEDTRLFPHSEKPKQFYKICRNFFN